MNISKAVLYSSLFSPITRNFAQNMSTQLPTMLVKTDLEQCKKKICEQWNEFLYIENYKNLPKIKNWLNTHDFRCNSSNPTYKVYESLDKCRKDLCRFAKMTGKSLKKCFIDTEKLTSLWNTFCSKADFNSSDGMEKSSFIYNCFSKICAHRSEEKSPDLNFLCMSLDLKSSVKNLKKIFQDWLAEMKAKEKKENKTESSIEIPHSILLQESALGVTSSVFNIVSSVVGIVASGIALYASKVTLSKVATTLPNISLGLRNMVDGTLAYSRWASTLTNTFLTAHTPSSNTPPSLLSVQQVSQISSQISSIYQNSMDSQFLSPERNDFTEEYRDITFNFNEEVKNSNVDTSIPNEEVKSSNVNAGISNEELDNSDVDAGVSNKKIKNSIVDDISHEVGYGSSRDSNNFNKEIKNDNIDQNVSYESEENVDNAELKSFHRNIFPTRSAKTLWEILFESYVKKQ